MQKALEMMNIKLHTAIRDITGKTGMAIMEAIIDGERIPENLMKYVDKHIKADHDTIVKSLEGNWRDEQLYLLQDCHCDYLHYKQRIDACDVAIENQLKHFNSDSMSSKAMSPPHKPTKRPTKNKPKFNMGEYFRSILGVDVTAIFGISDISAL